jgi:protein-disulfide isomerase
MSPKQHRQTSTKKTVKEERVKRERQKRLRTILLIVGGALVIVLGIFAVNYFTGQGQAPVAQGDIVVVTPKVRPLVDGHSMGDPNAPVKIIEYSDFQCPYCKQFADNTEQALIDNYIDTGKVYFTYHSMGNFVSQNIGKGTESQDAAEASYCASDQGKFWEYKDILFANALGEGQGYFALPRLQKMAEALGLDMTQFNDCMKSNKYLNQVRQDYADGIAAGVTGTPSFIINGELVTGAQPFSFFQDKINSILASGG